MMVFLSDTEDDPARELEAIAALHQRRVDGIILAPCADPERRALAYLRAARVPCVLVDRMPEPAFDQVGVNNRGAMRSSSIMSPRSVIGASATSPAIPASRRRMERINGYRDGLARPRTRDRRALACHRQTHDRNAPPTRRRLC